MRHNVYGKHLGRDKNQRTALFRGLIRSLVLTGSIVSTEAKIKSIKGLVDKLFSRAKKGDLASLNVITKLIPQKEISKKIMELAKGFKERNSGFTETVRLGMRQGDGTMMMRMSIIGSTENQKTEKLEKPAEKENIKTEIMEEVMKQEEIRKSKEEKKPAKVATKKESKK